MLRDRRIKAAILVLDIEKQAPFFFDPVSPGSAGCVCQAELIELGSLRGAQPHCLATMQQPVAAIGVLSCLSSSCAQKSQFCADEIAHPIDESETECSISLYILQGTESTLLISKLLFNRMFYGNFAFSFLFYWFSLSDDRQSL